MKRPYIDPPRSERCVAAITLRDGTNADCGRRKMVGDLCRQHSRRIGIINAKSAAPLVGRRALLRYVTPTGQHVVQLLDAGPGAYKRGDRVTIGPGEFTPDPAGGKAGIF